MVPPPEVDWRSAMLANRRPAPAPIDPEKPVLAGSGPTECSSSTALSVLPDVIWDVNGYYRELGAPHRASRGDLRRAYQSKDGQSSPRLTYIFRQLLQPEVRYAYDCSPPGEPFWDDYVADALNKKIKAEASRRMAQMAMQGNLYDQDEIEADVAADMGLNFDGNDLSALLGDLSDTPDQVVDSPLELGKDDASPAKFDYSFYLWSLPRVTTSAEALSRATLLSQWQRLLIRALSSRGIRMQFAVGLHGKPHRWVQAKIGYRTVFLFNPLGEPDESVADDIATQLLAG